jgi:signal transduction histidine kinase
MSSPDKAGVFAGNGVNDGPGRRIVAPQHVLVLTALFAALCLFGEVWVLTGERWLGMTVIPAEGGVEVVEVAAGGPSGGKLLPGDRILAVESASGSLTVDGFSAEVEPAVASPVFAKFNSFFVEQEKLYPLLSQDEVTLRLADGRDVIIHPAAKRPLADLPARFWVLFLFSFVVLQVGMGIWAYRPDRFANRLIAITAISYVANSLPFAVIDGREWVLNPRLFLPLDELNDLGAIAFSYSALALLAYYPRTLFRAPFALWCVAATALVWGNDVLQLIQWPWHTFAFPNFIPYTLGIYVAWRQWRATRLHPDQRAALKYFVLSVLITIGLVMFLFEFPRLFGAPSIISAWVAELVLCGFYAGLVLGVLRFRLFELERWWFTAWLWFLGGVLVVTGDLALVYLAGMQPMGALGVSLLLAGWIYFPLRQWMWSRMVRSPSLQVESYLPLLLEAFFASPGQDSNEQWLGAVRKIFDPLDAQLVTGGRDEVAIERDGLALTVPGIASDGRHILLTGRSRGERLFSREDAALAGLIRTLALKSAGLRAAHERGAMLERERIARDLHDDVAPLLLTLIHRAEGEANAERARNALQTLRESIYALNDPGEEPLQPLISAWRHELAERAEGAGVAVEWRQQGKGGGIQLDSRQRLNLARVLREAASNALRHARPTRLRVGVRLAQEELTVEFTNDGDVAQFDGHSSGSGLSNMRTRIAELGGSIRWDGVEEEGARWLRVTWSVPVVRREARTAEADITEMAG